MLSIQQIWKADNAKLMAEVHRIMKERDTHFDLNINFKKMNDIPLQDFMSLMIRLETSLGIDVPGDYKKYIGNHRKINTTQNNVKVKWLLVTYFHKQLIAPTLASKPVTILPTIKKTYDRKILPDISAPTYNLKQQVSDEDIEKFYKSFEWKRLRYEALRKYGARCSCCGAKPETNNDIEIRVDHIKPIRFYWEKRLDIDNLQVLCNCCNWGKGSLYHDTWREK